MIDRRERAFTLVELIIVVAVVGIMASLAVPNLRPMFQKDNLRSSTSSVTSALYIARTKAVNDGRPFGVIFQTNEFYVVNNPHGTPSWRSKPFKLETGVSIRSNTFVSGTPVFNEYGQLEKSCLPAGRYTGAISLTRGGPDSTRVEVTFISGRIRETNK
jgi:prepilin-type N-terminal cleavage/methylation domain-containing protein